MVLWESFTHVSFDSQVYDLGLYLLNPFYYSFFPMALFVVTVDNVVFFLISEGWLSLFHG